MGLEELQLAKVARGMYPRKVGANPRRILEGRLVVFWD